MSQKIRRPTVALIGKSTVPSDDGAYLFTKQLAFELVAKGYQIRHGGYTGGIMEAAAEGANMAIAETGLGRSYNMGVPEVRFDATYARTSATLFLPPAKDICDRLRGMILESDFIVVAPRGGDGTMLELQLALHENLLAGLSGIVRPIILCELPHGTPWTAILNSQLA